MFGNTPTIDVSQWFSVNSTSGVVYVSGQLDRENASEVILTISGTDLASNDAATSTTDPDGMFKEHLNLKDFILFVHTSSSTINANNWMNRRQDHMFSFRCGRKTPKVGTENPIHM